MNLVIRISLLLCLAMMAACSGKEDTTRQQNAGPDLAEASTLNIQLALGYIQRNQLEVAQDKLLKAIEQDPTNVNAYTTMAYLKSLIGEDEDAENFYLEAIDIKPADPGIHNSYGTLLCKLKRYDEGLEQFRLAYDNPFYENKYKAYINAGTCMLEQKDFTNAEKMLRKGLREQPRYSSGLLSMAELGVETGNYLMARAYIQRYHAVAQRSAHSLWLQIQAEKALGAQEHYIKYSRLLLKEFPDSDEAGELEEMALNERKRD
jgi:type IV pilus assembly protein PilF